MNAVSFVRAPALACLILGGCAVAFPVQYIPNSPLTADYRSDSYSFKVIDLTPSSALEANTVWSYQPRQIPPSLQSDSSEPGQPRFRATSFGDDSQDCATEDCFLIAQVAQNIGGSGGTENLDFRDPPRSLPQPYKIGVGDIFTVTVESTSTGTPTSYQRDVIVDYAGNIYLTDVGELNILGKTVAEARQAIADRFRDARTSLNGSGTVTGFNSQQVVVSSPGKSSSFLPITTTPITLREAYLKFSSGIDADAERQIVVLRRNGERYPIRGKDVLRRSYGYDVYLGDGDEVQIFDSYLNDVPGAAISPDVLALNEARLEQERFEQREVRADREEQRAIEAAEFARRQEQRALEEFELAKSNAERLERAENRAAAAEARAITAETRAEREEARAARDEARREAAEARAEAVEARAEAQAAREARQLELAEISSRNTAAQLDLAERREGRDRARIRIDLSIEGQDRIFVSGEVGKQQTIALPFGRQFTLAEAIYGAEGIEPITGDPSRIYIVRAKSTVDRSIESYIFHFDGSNLANTSAMTMFEMRPNDYVVAMPRGITNWSRFISQLLPTFSSIIQAARI